MARMELLSILSILALFVQESIAQCGTTSTDTLIEMCTAGTHIVIPSTSSTKLHLRAVLDPTLKSCSCRIIGGTRLRNLTLDIVSVPAVPAMCASELEITLPSGTQIYNVTDCANSSTPVFRHFDYTVKASVTGFTTDQFCTSQLIEQYMYVTCEDPLYVYPLMISIENFGLPNDGTTFQTGFIELFAADGSVVCKADITGQTLPDAGSTMVGFVFCDDLPIVLARVSYSIDSSWGCMLVLLQRVDRNDPPIYIPCLQTIGDPGVGFTYEGGTFNLTVPPTDYCIGNVCVHGTCVSGTSNYTCDCTNSGYEGDYCDTDVNECASNPCLNGGTCTDQVNGFSCTCPYGTGSTDHCQDNVDDCFSPNPPCLNGASCVDGVNTYTCSCPGGYEGVYCQTAQTCPFPTDGSTYKLIDLSVAMNERVTGYSKYFFATHNVTSPFCRCQIFGLPANNITYSVSGSQYCMSHFSNAFTMPFSSCGGEQSFDMGRAVTTGSVGQFIYFANYDLTTVTECFALTAPTTTMFWMICGCL